MAGMLKNTHYQRISLDCCSPPAPNSIWYAYATPNDKPLLGHIFSYFDDRTPCIGCQNPLHEPLQRQILLQEIGHRTPCMGPRLLLLQRQNLLHEIHFRDRSSCITSPTLMVDTLAWDTWDLLHSLNTGANDKPLDGQRFSYFCPNLMPVTLHRMGRYLAWTT